MKGRERGAVLIVVVIFTTVSMMFALSFLELAGTDVRLTGHMENAMKAQFAAEAGLEQVKYRVNTSPYDAYGNIWLRSNSSPRGTLAIDDAKVGDATVDVTITDHGNGWFTALSEATVGASTSRVAIEIRGRDYFSRFMFFVHHDNINIGRTTVRGDVHSNRAVNFFFGGAQMYGDVTACHGIGFYSGARPENTTFHRKVDGASATIKWPSVSDVATRKDIAQGRFKITNSNPLYSGYGFFHTELEFNRDLVTVTLRRTSGQILTRFTSPLPRNNFIYVEGPVTSLKGDINGRVTLATLDRVDITGSIRYVDDDGDPAYRLVDRNGRPVGNTPHGVAWTERNGYYYVQNPNYDNPLDPFDDSVPSCLGIMALKDIRITDAAPYNVEMHATLVSLQGNWHCSLNQRKGNLRVLGSMTHKTRGWRYNNMGFGWALSGEYIYDENLRIFPPEHFLDVEKPIFASWRGR